MSARPGPGRPASAAGPPWVLRVPVVVIRWPPPEPAAETGLPGELVAEVAWPPPGHAG